MIQIKKYYILRVLVFSGFILGCSNPSPEKRDGFSAIKDMAGREVIVPLSIQRIIGLRAGALRLLVYMDAVDLIAGVEETEKMSGKPYLTAHPKLAELPSIGPSMGGDIELILKAQPDVIFISYTTKGNADMLQQRTGIPVIVIECPEFAIAKDTLFESLRLIGKVLNKTSRADSLVAYISHSINELDKRTNNIPESIRPLVYIGGVPYSGSFGITSTQPWYPPFVFTNARNAASGINQRLISHVKGTHIDKEQLILWNPDFLFFDESGLKLIKNDLAKGTALHTSLKAVKNNSMYVLLPYNNYAINYELVLVNSWYTAKTLYPEYFTDIEIEEKINEILQAFLGKKIYSDIVKNSKALQKIDINQF